jgi:hypothetical protein
MGWYTEGPGGFGYKYGDVIAVARSSEVGTLCAIPCVLAEDMEGDSIDEFLGPLQEVIEKTGLPWRHVEFSHTVDPHGESIQVEHDVDPARMLREFTTLVAEHAGSVRSALAATPGRPEVTVLVVGLNWFWNVTPDEIPALVGWLNAPFGDLAPVTIDGLRAGTIDLGDYVPPATLAAVFERSAKEDAARHLALCALAHATLAGENLFLDQPDDDHQLLAWEDDG